MVDNLMDVIIDFVGVVKLVPKVGLEKVIGSPKDRDPDEQRHDDAEFCGWACGCSLVFAVLLLSGM